MKKMYHVAKQAGVSCSTVSRVLNGNSSVSENTRKRVQKAIQEIQYIPHHHKRHPGNSQSILGLKKSTIAILLRSMNTDTIHTPMVNNIITGIGQTLSELGMNTIVAAIDNDQALPPVISTNNNTDGFILISGAELSADCLRHIGQTPCVGVFMNSHFDSVHADNDAVGRLAANYLINRGLHNLAFLNACPYHPDFQARRKAFVYYAEEAGATVDILVDTEEVRPITANLDQHEDVISSLVKQYLKLSPRPKGLFVPSDLQTAVVYRNLRQRGLELGIDVTVVSCDNWQSVLAGLDPRPATIDTHPEIQGKIAVSQLFWRIKHLNIKPHVTLTVTPELVDKRMSVMIPNEY